MSPPKPLLEDIDHFISTPRSPFVLNKSLVNTNYLFFNQYTPENIFKPC